jgi:ABC-type multidrug transport system permease subunit
MSSATSPVWQLTLSRLREFYREPAAVFWVYGFPLVLALALGIAFRERPTTSISVDLFETSATVAEIDALEAKLKAFLAEHPDGGLELKLQRTRDSEQWKERLRAGNCDLVITLIPTEDGKFGYEFWQEPSRPESVLALNVIEKMLLQKELKQSLPISERRLEETGKRYIDFLIPGLIGMNLMGGGLWGVGFVIVDMRVRKLLKRFLATPMVRSHFLLSIMLSRLFFTIPEVFLLLAFGYFIFEVKVAGSLLVLLLIFLLGAIAFSGIGLLVASRAKTVETVSGLMNLVMLPMFVLSGVFFSADRFPESAQGFIQALPLTALNNAIRGVMLEGKGLLDLLAPLGVLAAWGAITFTLALRIFRWR